MMKKRLFSALIVFLGLMASFVFYGFLETEPSPSIAHTKDAMTMPIDTFDTHTIEQKEIKHTVMLPKHSIDKNMPINEVSIEAEPLDIPYDTSEAMEAHTQEVYASLQPDNYDESIAEANEAFEVLDEHVHQVEEQLQEHMQISLPQESTIQSNAMEEEPYEMELPIIQE